MGRATAPACRASALLRRHSPSPPEKARYTMNGTTLHKTAADCAEELPGAQLEHPFVACQR